MSLSDDIKKARKSAGKTQQDVADHLGVSVQAVSQWENGRTLPGSAKLVQLAQFIGLQLQDKIDLKSVLFDTRDATRMALAPLVKWTDHKDWSQYDFDIFADENTKGLYPEEVFGVHWKPKGDIYALKVGHHLIRPEFDSNDVIIIDTGRSPERGDFVVVKAEKSVSARLGIYEPMGFDEHRAPIFAIKNLVEGSGPLLIINSENPGFVLGVVREKRRFYRMD